MTDGLSSSFTLSLTSNVAMSQQDKYNVARISWNTLVMSHKVKFYVTGEKSVHQWQPWETPAHRCHPLHPQSTWVLETTSLSGVILRRLQTSHRLWSKVTDKITTWIKISFVSHSTTSFLFTTLSHGVCDTSEAKSCFSWVGGRSETQSIIRTNAQEACEQTKRNGRAVAAHKQRLRQTVRVWLGVLN